MRQAINENRTVQLAIVGALALAGALFLLMSKGGSSSSSTTTSATGTATAPAVPGATATAPSGTAPSGTATATPVTNSSTAGAVASAAGVPVNLIPGPGLPKGLIPAWKGGDAIVLLIRRAGGIDDNLVNASVDRLRSESGVKVYVTLAKSIARYAWLTQGVQVSQLPALVVLRPRKLTKGTPTAAVSYGFRGPNSVVQAVRDELYRGPTNEPYHPLG